MSRRQQEIAVVAIGVCIFGAWWLWAGGWRVFV